MYELEDILLFRSKKISFLFFLIQSQRFLHFSFFIELMMNKQTEILVIWILIVMRFIHPFPFNKWHLTFTSMISQSF